jgi:rhodanese-related sulfurtransferase
MLILFLWWDRILEWLQTAGDRLQELPYGATSTFLIMFGITAYLGRTLGKSLTSTSNNTKTKQPSALVVKGRSKTTKSVRAKTHKVNHTATTNHESSSASQHGSPDVASVSQLKEFVAAAAEKLVILDTRNTQEDVFDSSAPLPNSATKTRPQAKHCPWNRTTQQLDDTNDTLLQDLPKDTPIITHCGGGGRGQAAHDYLVSRGYTKVLNGGGPKLAEHWAVYGDK